MQEDCAWFFHTNTHSFPFLALHCKNLLNLRFIKTFSRASYPECSTITRKMSTESNWGMTLSVNLNANKDLKEPSMEWIFQYAPSTRGVWWMENLDNSPKSLATILVEEKRNKKLPIGNWLALKSILQLGKKSVWIDVIGTTL